VSTFTFVVYVAGTSRGSDHAAENLRRLCAERLPSGSYEIEVVDIIEHPERAEADRVIATPTVIRETPAPRRRVIGDLSVAASAAHALAFPEPTG
jgi:circadian clock protein KaiB